MIWGVFKLSVCLAVSKASQYGSSFGDLPLFRLFSGGGVPLTISNCPRKWDSVNMVSNKNITP